MGSYVKCTDAVDPKVLDYIYKKYTSPSVTNIKSSDHYYLPGRQDSSGEVLPDFDLCKVDKADILLVLGELRKRKALDNFNMWHNSTAAFVHKLKKGNRLGVHRDPCFASITLCLTDGYTGGDFIELDDEDEIVTTISLSKNEACVYQNPVIGYSESPQHYVTEVLSGSRITLQMFIPNQIINIKNKT